MIKYSLRRAFVLGIIYLAVQELPGFVSQHSQAYAGQTFHALIDTTCNVSPAPDELPSCGNFIFQGQSHSYSSSADLIDFLNQTCLDQGNFELDISSC